MLIYVTQSMLKRKSEKISEIGTNIIDIININILNTEKAIPLWRSANFLRPIIRTALEDWQLQSGFTCAYAIFTWNFQIIPSVGMWLRIWLPVQFQNTKPFLATAGVNSKFSVAFTSSLQIFTDVISLKEKQMECIWRITYLEEDVLVVFPTGFDKRHDSESDKIVSPHWVVVVSPLQYTRKQQVENLQNTHWRIELVF